MMPRKILGWAAAVGIALLAWGGGSIVNLLQRVSSVEAEQKGLDRWLESIDSRLERIEGAIRRRPPVDAFRVDPTLRRTPPQTP